MKYQRLRQTAVSLCVVLSLFASSVAACICHDSTATASHCEPPHSHESSADAHSHESESHEVSAHQDLPSDHQEFVSTAAYAIDVSLDECCCASSAPRFFAKSEIVKLEKQTTNYQPNAPPELKIFIAAENVQTIAVAKPFYLSDSFYNLKSPRAPPRL